MREGEIGTGGALDKTKTNGITGMNDNELRPVTIITGRVRRNKGDDSQGVHVLLVAPDDDTAVRTALEALAREGYAEAELDRHRAAAEAAAEAGLIVNAGHDLDLGNLAPYLRAVPGVAEVSIGQALLADALVMGLDATVRAYLDVIETAHDAA